MWQIRNFLNASIVNIRMPEIKVDYLLRERYKLFENSRVTKLGNFLNALYKKYWMIKAYFPIVAGVLMLLTLVVYGI